MLGRRWSVALATTVGAALLATAGGPASAYDGWNGGYNGGDTGGWNGGTDPGTVTPPPLPVDPGTLGDPIAGSFVAATFNVLGSSHTKGIPGRSGARRMVSTVQLLQDNQVDLVGLQELENPQFRALQRLAGVFQEVEKDAGELVGIDHDGDAARHRIGPPDAGMPDEPGIEGRVFDEGTQVHLRGPWRGCARPAVRPAVSRGLDFVDAASCLALAAPRRTAGPPGPRFRRHRPRHPRTPGR